MIAAMVPPVPPLPTDIAALLALPLLLAAAAADVAWRRIPNGIAAALAAIGLLRHAGAGAGALGLALLVACGVLAAGMLLWRRGLIGGGDVKLLAAVALLLPPGAVPALLLAVPLAGGVLALGHLALGRLLRGRPPAARGGGRLRRILRREGRRIARGAPLPYGVAIAAGAIAVLAGPGG